MRDVLKRRPPVHLDHPAHHDNRRHNQGRRQVGRVGIRKSTRQDRFFRSRHKTRLVGELPFPKTKRRWC